MTNGTLDIEKVVREYIDKTIHLSLATVGGNKPWVCEVHFAYDDNLNLYFRSLTSRRHSQEIATNPNIAGNIVKQHALNEEVHGVYFEGTAKLLGPGNEQNIAFDCLKNRLAVDESVFEEAKREDGRQFYKITVKDWYVFGCFGNQHGQKYKLKWGYE